MVSCVLLEQRDWHCSMIMLLLFDFVCSFSHLNMPGVRMSDLRSVQFDVCDGDDEVVSIASDIYTNIRLSVNGRFKLNSINWKV